MEEKEWGAAYYDFEKEVVTSQDLNVGFGKVMKGWLFGLMRTVE
jgi:hypothetical protein